MDISLRKKALRNLAKTGGQKAIEAIEKEMVRLQSILSSSCYYEGAFRKYRATRSNWLQMF